AWMWYHTHIGGGRCPIVDTWWQTETGAHMVNPLPGVTATKPGAACEAIPGVSVEVVDESGNRVERGGGYLTITEPWPSMLRGTCRSPSCGRRCGEASGATRSGRRRRTGPPTRAATSPVTGRRSTTTATSGCGAGWTT